MYLKGFLGRLNFGRFAMLLQCLCMLGARCHGRLSHVIPLSASVDGSWTSPTGSLSLSWKAGVTRVRFSITHEGDAWVGFGVSAEGRMSFNEAIVGEWSEGYEYLGSIPRALRYNLDGYAPDAVTLSGDGTVIEYASPEEAAARIASELGIDGEVASRAFIADAGETISEPMQELLGIETEVETEVKSFL